MYYDVKRVKYLDGYSIEIEFVNGNKGIMNFEKYLSYGGIFNRLTDIDYFRKAYVDPEMKVLCWPNGLDIAPEVLYSETTGEPLPQWMTVETVDH